MLVCGVRTARVWRAGGARLGRANLEPGADNEHAQDGYQGHGDATPGGAERVEPRFWTSHGLLLRLSRLVSDVRSGCQDRAGGVGTRRHADSSPMVHG